jgi:N-acetylneuraminic acid mutarotase
VLLIHKDRKMKLKLMASILILALLCSQFIVIAINTYSGNSSLNSSPHGTVDGKTIPNLFDDFETVSHSGWIDRQSMLENRADPTAAVWNNKLYVFGGYYNGSRSVRGETFEYDPILNAWTQKASMPTPRWGSIAIQFDGKIYVMGGECANSSRRGGNSANEIYDPATNRWETKSAVPSDLANQGLMGVSYRGEIQLFYKNHHYTYNPSTNTYSRKADLPTPRTWATCAIVDGKIYVIGGYSYRYPIGATNVCEAYDPSTDTWTTRSPMPTRLYGAARENPVIDGKIYVTHGRDSGFHGTVYVYDPSTDRWENRSSSLHPRDGVACGVIFDKLYIVGGRADDVGPHGLDFNEEYNPRLDAAHALTVDQAKGAAIANMSVTLSDVKSVCLENENGNMVYTIHVAKLNVSYDVKVDAGNGHVLSVERNNDGATAETGQTEEAN